MVCFLFKKQYHVGLYITFNIGGGIIAEDLVNAYCFFYVNYGSLWHFPSNNCH